MRSPAASHKIWNSSKNLTHVLISFLSQRVKFLLSIKKQPKFTRAHQRNSACKQSPLIPLQYLSTQQFYFTNCSAAESQTEQSRWSKGGDSPWACHFWGLVKKMFLAYISCHLCACGRSTYNLVCGIRKICIVTLKRDAHTRCISSRVTWQQQHILK